MSEPLSIISIGLGVQSSMLHKMAEKGAFGKKPSMSIFADTKQEPRSVYAWKEKMEAEATIPIVTVSQGDLAAASLVIRRSGKSGLLYLKGLIPAFTLNPDGDKGLMGRKCTQDFKVVPIQRKCRELIGKEALLAWRRKHRPAIAALNEWRHAVKEAKKQKQVPPLRPSWAWDQCQQDALVVQWIGISADEASRAKESRVEWIRSEWPLLEKRMTRNDCKRGLNAPRSACKFCPFHGDEEWARLKKEEPLEFERAGDFEIQLQAQAQDTLRSVPYLHESCKPLREVDFTVGAPSHQQVNLFNNECEGMCGV